MFDLDAALRREWLETNGLGGYASSTIVGLNTRRYHGLLVAATSPPVGRMVLLSKFEETLVVDGRRHELSANRYPGVIYPDGYLLLREFRHRPVPTFVYRIDGVELQKTVSMVRGENTSLVRYTWRSIEGASPIGVRLELRPLIAFRDFHSTTHENDALNNAFEIQNGSVRIEPYSGLPPLYLNHNGAEVEASGIWFRNFEYDRERERGLDFREDLFNPFVLIFDLQDGRPASVAASTLRRQADIELPQLTSMPVLSRAAAQFIVKRGEQTTVIAGYHWFGDWGRDTMIAIPGLTLATGRQNQARSILQAFAGYVDCGMLPNQFPDGTAAPGYNTVDATLWFFEAVRALLENSHDYSFVQKHLYPVLSDILAWHEKGTRYGIRVDNDGLLQAGQPGVALTWMDAVVDGRAVTPRIGKPVEIQALWYNALRIMQDLARRYGYAADADHYRDLAMLACKSFTPAFWNEQAQCLFDVVDKGACDASLRPNQIFAVSLFHRMLAPGKCSAVVLAVERALLTPYGLRTLSPDDPNYRGRYEGDMPARDAAYHQGTVWPWLLGPFISAYLFVHNHSPAAQANARQWLIALRRYAEDDGLGQLPEVFDGDAPHRPGGCIAQAWSVAELLRVGPLE